jgi:nitroreductase
MQAAALAPSCSNNQPWRFIVVNQTEILDRLKQHLSNGNYWAKPSPCIVLAVTKAELACRLNDGRDYAFLDLGLACENLILQAVAEGLIAHPIAGFSPLPIKELFKIPPDYTLITLIILGYPGDIGGLNQKHRQTESSARIRKPEAEVIGYNKWPDVSP